MRLPPLLPYRPLGAAISVVFAAVCCRTVSSFSQEAAPTGSASIPGTLTVTQSGQHFAVYRWVVPATGLDGTLGFRTNFFTLLENNLNYLENGIWKPSEDLIESFPTGAVARRGPTKAVFSNDLNTDVAFDIQSADGQRLRGGVRGASVTLGTVKQSVLGQLVPPSEIVWEDAFEGVKADVVVVWKHNQFSQNVLLRERPVLPSTFNPDSTRIEVLTEFLAPPQPLLREQVYSSAGAPDITEDVVITFGELFMPRGKAFQVDAGDALTLGAWEPGTSGAPVVKQWQMMNDGSGSAFLVESVAWPDIQPDLENLPASQASAGGPGDNSDLAESRVWPKWSGTQPIRAPIQLASAPYHPDGLLVDYSIGGSVSSFTFTNGVTFFITNTFYIGPNAATFQPGCTVKYTNTSSWLIAFGPVSFSNTLQTPVFTSKDDNGFGDTIPGSTGSPGYQASEALWIYYPTFSTSVQNARFRWAQRGVEYDGTATHTIQNCLFENCQVGIQDNLPSYALTLNGVSQYSVATPIGGNSAVNGSMSTAPFHAVNAFSGMAQDTNTSRFPVPDTMGAIGPSQFFEVLNAGVAVFNRTDGTLTASTNLPAFFQTSAGDTLVDPRVLFDNGANPRWAASVIDSKTNLILQVSRSTNATPLDSSNWKRFVVQVPVADTNQFLDYQTLGMDLNGLYLSVQIRGGSGNSEGFRIQGFQKPAVYTNTNYTAPPMLSVATNVLNTWCIQPAYSFDIPTNGYAWFVAKGPSSGANGGQVRYSRFFWSGSNLMCADTNWPTLATATDYYDIPQGTTNFNAQERGGSVDLGETGSRLMMAVIRNGYLWTCHHVGLNSQGTYTTNADRSGIPWFQLQVGGSALTVSNQGRVYDATSSNPYWYYFPSLALNASGDMVMGFSGSNANEYGGAFFYGRKANGSWLPRPMLVQAGRSQGYISQWGDYSATTADPTDGSLWTVQQFGSLCYDGLSWVPIWATWVNKISP
jgi:hypothetical protein